MKVKILLAFFIFSLVGFTTQAQTTLKVGYANVDYILSKMPETKQVQVDLEAASVQLKDQLDKMVEEYQLKLKDYEQTAATMLPAVKNEKETEITQLQQRIQKFQADAQASVQSKHAELMKPLYEKIQNTINTVAKEGSYSFIMNSQINGGNIMLFADKQLDVSDVILKKMGVI